MFECNNIYSIWDKRLIRGVKNYRRLAKQVEYKGTRDVKRNNHVFSFEDKTTDILKPLGVKNMYPGILEADDVISWMCKHTPGRKMIVSVDQDMLQLVDENTSVYSPIKDVVIDYNNFEAITGVPREQFLRYKSLVGDKSDNLPGVERCGKKTAQKLIKECVDDRQLIDRLGEDKLEPYFFNMKMIDLNYGLKQHPGDVELYQKQHEDHKQTTVDFDIFIERCEDHGLTAVLNKRDIWRDVFVSSTQSKSSINPRSLENIVNSLGLSK